MIGRVIVGLYYITSGINHFTNLKAMAGYAASKGVFLPQIAVIFTGFLLLGGGLSILLGYYPKIGVLLLLMFFIPVTFIMHNFWAYTEPMQRMAQSINFMKNMALLGSALMFLMIPEPWEFSIRKK